MLVYIAGSGAMGCTIAYNIAKNSDNEVILLDYWQEHIDQINNNGLRVKGKFDDNIKIKSMKPEEASKKADLIVVMTKSMALRSMMEAISHLINDESQILCLLNGMGHEEILKDFVNMDQINMGVTIWAAALDGPGLVDITGIGTIDIQNIGGDQEAGNRIAEILNEGKLNASYDSNVKYAIWRKVMVNGTMNSMTSLLQCTVGEFFETKESEKIIDKLVSEFVKVAKADGVKIDKEEMLDYIYQTSKSAKNHYPSMYQDLIVRNKKTEIDFINGAVVNIGKKHGISTPYNELICQLIHAKENLIGAD